MLNSPAPALGDVFTKEDIRVTRFARDLHSRLTMARFTSCLLVQS
jgi:hypothetical protein